SRRASRGGRRAELGEVGPRIVAARSVPIARNRVSRRRTGPLTPIPGAAADHQCGTVDLPDDAKLLRELRCLERRHGSAGRDRVDHPLGQHDDRANAVAGVVVALAMERTDETITAIKIPILYRQSIWRAFDTTY